MVRADELLRHRTWATVCFGAERNNSTLMPARIKAALAAAALLAAALGARAWFSPNEDAAAQTQPADAELERYQQQFALGVTRLDVVNQLNAAHVAIENPEMVLPASGQGDLLIRLGNGPAEHWYCSSEQVYVDMHFASSTAGHVLDPASRLEAIDLKRQERDCL